ncbi:hypothetical protein VPH35_038320 [Triticum aestivum]
MTSHPAPSRRWWINAYSNLTLLSSSCTGYGQVQTVLVYTSVSYSHIRNHFVKRCTHPKRTRSEKLGGEYRRILASWLVFGDQCKFNRNDFQCLNTAAVSMYTQFQPVQESIHI